MRALLRTCMIHPFYTIAALVATVCVTLAEVAIPLVTARAVDTATQQATPTRLWSWITNTTGWTPLTAVVVVLILIALIRYLFQFSRRYFAGEMSLWTQHELRLRVLASLQRLDGPGQDNIRTGQVVSRSISDLSMVQGLLAMFPLAAGSFLKIAITLVVMFALSWTMSLAAIIITPLLILLGAWSRKAIFASTWSAQQQAANVATHVEQTVTGVRVVKGFAQEEREIDTLDRLSQKLYSLQMRAARQQAKFLPTLAELPNVALVANVAVGGWLAMHGHITIGVFLAFASYLSSLTAVARMLSNMVISMQMARSSVSRVFDVINLAPEKDPAHPRQIPEGPLGVRMNRVRFVDKNENNEKNGDANPETATTQASSGGSGDRSGDSIHSTASTASSSAFTSSTGNTSNTDNADYFPTTDMPEDQCTAEHCCTECEELNCHHGRHQQTILNDFTLDIAAGETVVLVGPPGSGKSMLVQLLGNFYPVDGGSIELTNADGSKAVNLEDLRNRDIRQAVTCVFDEPFLYSRSIRDNIALADPHASQEEIERAARDACAHDFITELPDGYDTIAGERGLTLSGGQRQRIALARALVSGARVLVLDDATSAIDAATEARIISALHARKGQVTLLIVAHRHSTLALADRIALVEQGRVTACGTLAEMQRTSPQFLRLMSLPAVEGGVPVPLDEGALPDQEALWPGLRDPHEAGAAAATDEAGMMASDTQAAASNVGAGLGGGGGARNGPGMMAGMPPTPEILALVEQLPPATEKPAIDTAQFRNDDTPFSLRALLSNVKWLIAAVVALLIISVAADVVFPTLVRHAIDGGVVAGHSSAIVSATLLGLFVVALSWLASALNTILTSRAGERLLYGLRLRSFAHVQRLGLDYFETTQSGRIMTRMTTDIDSLSKFLQTGLAQAIVSAATLLGVSTMLVITAPRLALVALIALPLVIGATVVFRRISSRLYSESRSQISTVNADFQEIIGGIRTAQMYGYEAEDMARFTTDAKRYRKLRMQAQTAVSIYFPGVNAMSELAKAAVMGVGATMVLDGSLSAGVLVAFMIYMDLLFNPIQQLSQVFDQYQQAEVGLNRISDLLAEKSSVPNDGVITSVPAGDVVLDHVAFGYHNGPEVIHGIDATIAEGTTVAVVGTTGAGKSTIIKLLARFYDTTGGAVRAVTTDIRDIELTTWRQYIGLVPQEAHLFPGTIASNIAYGKPEATPAEVMSAAQRIGALSAIAAIPGGFLAPVGENGRGLSSGQRQLIALARAELVEPNLMLLDEATATLDPATEATILEASKRLTSRRTSVIVAHRLATAAHADTILVMEEGRIVEKGSHDTLLALGGTYSDLWEHSTAANGGP